ncbi:hypothetical protein D3827_09955 [Streptococcus mutans]|uniref:hypothetical protein n=1 Tax=Streptococcus mutans TaxID=1309 RepID=UPI0014559F34|nr:hypothetical protein [Streptococcus mutans]NLQ60089.1 hypothetical protein [Streptococcus mutans]
MLVGTIVNVRNGISIVVSLPISFEALIDRFREQRGLTACHDGDFRCIFMSSNYFEEEIDYSFEEINDYAEEFREAEDEHSEAELKAFFEVRDYRCVYDIDYCSFDSSESIALEKLEEAYPADFEVSLEELKKEYLNDGYEASNGIFIHFGGR